MTTAAENWHEGPEGDEAGEGREAGGVVSPGGGTPAGAADAVRHEARADADEEGDDAGERDVPAAPPLAGRRRGARPAVVKEDATEGRLMSPRERLHMLDLWQRSELPARDFGKLVGVSRHTLYAWRKRFAEHGPAGLEDGPRGGKVGSKLDELTKRAILMMKKEHPDYGQERISALLLRGPALAASPGAVARVLKEAGYEAESVETRPHAPPVRHFERARPNQLWQTDLFTFMLKRQQSRVYMVAFMDDHSRFVTGFGVHASQSGALVIDVLRAAIGAYGAPEEILTDNGSQYVTWRGKSAFTKELERRGIRQIVSRVRHPQTLGKVERFWGTLWREFLEPVVFRDLSEARQRIGLFIDHYNFQRPHQGLGGLVPADRFFGAADEVKRTLEARVARNALELALDGTRPSPFYLTGQVGGRAVSVHAEGEQLFLRREDGEREEIALVRPAPSSEDPGDGPPLPDAVCPQGTASEGAEAGEPGAGAESEPIDGSEEA